MRLSRMIILLSLMIAATAFADSVLAADKSDSAKRAIDKIALLPLGNYTQTDEYSATAVEQLTMAFYRNHVNVISSATLRPILREFRIRSRGSVAQPELVKLAGRVDCDYFIVGSLDLIRENEIPELSISLRALRPNEQKIVGAVSVSATGRDYTRMFGVGTVENLDSLIARVTEEAVELLIEQLTSKTAVKDTVPGRWAVITFDNGSSDRTAGQVLANWLISRMVSEGYEVIEPGTIDLLFRKLGGKAVGGIDSPRAGLLADSLQINDILTGEIDRFATGSGVVEASEPFLAFGVRLVDGRTGLVKTVYEVESHGNQYEKFFGAGRCRALGTLAERSIDNLLDRLNSDLTKFGLK